MNIYIKNLNSLKLVLKLWLSLKFKLVLGWKNVNTPLNMIKIFKGSNLSVDLSKKYIKTLSFYILHFCQSEKFKSFSWHEKGLVIK